MTGIDVCIATYRRDNLERAIRSVAAQVLPPDVSIRIVIADNDERPSAEPTIVALAARLAVPIRYVHVPARNISLARNALLDAAEAEWIAMIDDDETAAEDWLAQLLATAQAQNADIVFGPVLADYAEDAPAWITDHDYHSSIPLERGGEVRTGHTGNALIRRGAPALKGLRFDPALGLTGGEDTAFFFRAWRAGARMAIAPAAILFEPVEPSRLTWGWLSRRTFRKGQTYGYHAFEEGAPQRREMYAGALAKAVYCFICAGPVLWSRSMRNYWLLRGLFHWGVVSTLFGAREKPLYGEEKRAVAGEKR